MYFILWSKANAKNSCLPNKHTPSRLNPTFLPNLCIVSLRLISMHSYTKHRWLLYSKFSSSLIMCFWSNGSALFSIYTISLSFSPDCLMMSYILMILIATCSYCFFAGVRSCAFTTQEKTPFPAIPVIL